MARPTIVRNLRKRGSRTSWADPALVAAQASEWDTDILTCRTYGHAWRPFGGEDNGDGTVTETLRCLGCKSLASMDVSATNGEQLTDRKYSHAEGYLTKGLGRIGGDGRGQLRLAAWTRAKEEALDVRRLRGKGGKRVG